MTREEEVFHPSKGMKLKKCLSDYESLIQKVIKDVHHYNAIWHSMRRYVICCDHNFCKRVVCKS